MNILVVSNCATVVFVEALRLLKPAWNVRGADWQLATTWIDPATQNNAFVSFARACDVFISYAPHFQTFADLLPEDALRLEIPRYHFFGLHPDCMWLDGVESIFVESCHSRIVVESFRAGLTTAQTVERFTGATYDSFGYFAVFELECRKLIARYAPFGIDLSECLERWMQRGTMAFTYNHPRADVLVEILCRALVSAGLVSGSPVDAARAIETRDYFSESVIWPVYPEIAAAHGFAGSFEWRVINGPEFDSLDLHAFVAASFTKL